MKILIGLSGGVDSSVAAKLLSEQGHEVTGLTLQLLPSYGKNRTRQEQDIRDAGLTAQKLGIPHIICNMQKEFKQYIIDYFIDEYKNGRTPNPCFICNKKIKFGLLLQKAEEEGFEAIATGHYAAVEKSSRFGSERFLLKRGQDEKKDQSYFLALLSQEQFRRSLFPLASLEKQQVRCIAEKSGLINADRPESQDICFAPEGGYTEIINRYAKDMFSEGCFLDIKGNEIGRHRGLQYYTVGQRRGLAIAAGYPVYVISKNAAANTVTADTEKHLFASGLIADNVNLIAFDKLEQEMDVTVKTRYRQTGKPAKLIPLTESSVKIEFAEPEKAVAEGQAAVFYADNYVIGGGLIRSVDRLLD